jgi:hypothetical protein
MFHPQSTPRTVFTHLPQSLYTKKPSKRKKDLNQNSLFYKRRLKKESIKKKHCFYSQKTFLRQSGKYALGGHPHNPLGTDIVKRNVDLIGKADGDRKRKITMKKRRCAARKFANYRPSKDESHLSKLKKSLNPILYNDINFRKNIQNILDFFYAALRNLEEGDEASGALKEAFLIKVEKAFLGMEMPGPQREQLYEVLMKLFDPVQISKIPEDLRTQVTKLLNDKREIYLEE